MYCIIYQVEYFFCWNKKIYTLLLCLTILVSFLSIYIHISDEHIHTHTHPHTCTQVFTEEVERRLGFLSDERMVLKGFPEWPEKKVLCVCVCVCVIETEGVWVCVS